MAVKKLIVVLLMLISAGRTVANASDSALRFPEIYNPDPVAGRLYLQPMGAHDDRVMTDLDISVGFGSSTVYHVFFVEKDGDKEVTMNSNIYTLSMSQGVNLFGRTVEFGGTFRAFQDVKDSWGARLVKHYHQTFSSGFGEVPPDGQYYGGVGNNETRVIGDSNEFYLNTLQMYVKYQLSRENDGDSMAPDLAVKLSGRIPLSGKSFDTPGIGVSVGLSKTLSSHFKLIADGDLVYQDLTAEDFNADNLRVSSNVWDLFTGIIWDMGQEGGWYTQLGIRYSSERVMYPANPESADGAVVVHFGPVYRMKTKGGSIVEYYVTFNEDIPGLGHGLEPDVAFFSGISFSGF